MRRPKLTLALQLAISLVGSLWPSPEAMAADAQPVYRSHASVLGGAYSLSSTTKSSNSIGSLSFSYGYSLSESWRLLGSYNNIISTAGGIGSFVNGFDIGVQYCLFSCEAVTRQVGDLVTIREHSNFGLAVGAGLGQRAFQLTTQSIGFSGPFFRLEGNYFWSETLKILAAIQHNSLSNGASNLKFQSFSLGIGLDW
ncbi:MAG: hypothetical protein H7222_05480 [Methylotenera sp.]|nr:hypothetical protein [Oligoflexia bacterium]